MYSVKISGFDSRGGQWNVDAITTPVNTIPVPTVYVGTTVPYLGQKNMALARIEAMLPVDMVEIRPGRFLAVHKRLRQNCKDTIFFFHGSCASLVQWKSQLDHMSQIASVIACDMYGCGRSPKPDNWESYSSRSLVLDLEALIRRFGSTEGKQVIVGHSAAAGFALQMAANAAMHAGESPTLSLHISGIVTVSALVSIPSAIMIFRLPLCLLKRMQPTLNRGFVAGALHSQTRAASTDEHKVT